MNINEIKRKIEEKKINFFQVKLSIDVIEKGIQFPTIEEFLKFASNQKINTIFGCEYYDDINEYLITEEIIEKTIGLYHATQIQDIIIDDIENHNRNILKHNFNTPIAIIICCLYEGVYCFVYLEYSKNNKILIKDCFEKLDEIMENHKYEIQNKQEKKKEMLEQLKNELREKIKKDKKFTLCTNKLLRENYIKDLLLNKLNQHFEPLKKHWTGDTPRGIYRGAIDFIEIIWKEIQQKTNE